MSVHIVVGTQVAENVKSGTPVVAGQVCGCTVALVAVALVAA